MFCWCCLTPGLAPLRALEPWPKLSRGHSRHLCSQVHYRLHTAHWAQISAWPGLSGMWVWYFSDKACITVAPMEDGSSCPPQTWRTSRGASECQPDAADTPFSPWPFFLSPDFYHPSYTRTKIKDCFKKWLITHTRKKERKENQKLPL